jgi:DnaJ domain
MLPPSVEHRENPSTFNPLCACGCGESVKPGQRRHEPACKARAYRARQRAAREEKAKEAEEDYRHAFQQMIELDRKLRALECAYSELWEEHQDCPLASPDAAPQRPRVGDAYAVLGVRADAEPEAIEGAYKALAKKYHPDRHPGDPVAEVRMKPLTAAYAAVMRLRGERRKRREPT